MPRGFLEHHRLAAVRTVRSGVGQFLRRYAIGHRGLEGAAALQAFKKMLHLQAVGSGVALQEKGFRPVGGNAGRIPLHHLRGRVVAALQKAGGTQHFKALVIAIGSAARGVDLAQAALLCADGDGCAVKVRPGP